MQTPKKENHETAMFTSSATEWSEALISTYHFDRKRDQQAYDDLKTTHKQQREAFKLDDTPMDNTDMRIEDGTSKLISALFTIVGVIVGAIVVLNKFL